jgi:hypothetical protein
MEIHDGAYELLESVEYGTDPLLMFKDIDVGVFIGGFPRYIRKYLLLENKEWKEKIFCKLMVN